jgi:hypothetical protein
MADNVHAPFLSVASSDNSSEHSSEDIVTLSNESSVIRGANMVYTSLSMNNKIPQSSSPQKHHQQLPSIEYRVVPRVPEEQPLTKKPRERPPGSKNKPKPPIVIREDTSHLLKPIITEIDVVNALINFALRRCVGISVTRSSGTLSEVIICPPVAPESMPICGPFLMMSLNGTFMNTRSPILPVNPRSFFRVYLVGSKWKAFVGVVVGPIIAASLVVVVASMFKKTEFHKAPFIDGSIEDVGEG